MSDGYVAVGLDDNNQVILTIRTNDGMTSIVTFDHDRAKLISKLLKFITSEKLNRDQLSEGEFEDEK